MTTPLSDRPDVRGWAVRSRSSGSRPARRVARRPGEIDVVPTERGRVRSRAAPSRWGVANRVRLRYGRGGEADARGVRGSGFAGDVLGSGWRRAPSPADPTRRPPTPLRRTWSPTSRKCLPRARATRARHRLRPPQPSGRREGDGDAPAGYGRGYGRGPARGPRGRRGGNARAR